MGREEFKEQWKKLRVAGVSYGSLTTWLRIISKLLKGGATDQEITNHLRGFK